MTPIVGKKPTLNSDGKVWHDLWTWHKPNTLFTGFS